MSGHTKGPWFLEETKGMLWIGPKKAFSEKVGDVVTGIKHESGNVRASGFLGDFDITHFQFANPPVQP